jgi:uncharacterized protein (TIGR02588 family)
MSDSQSGKRKEKQAPDIPGWSWAVAAVGLLLLAGTVAYFLYLAFTSEDAPAEIVIETGEVVENAGGYLVPIQVTNHGRQVAAALTVEGALMDGETMVETSSMVLDYVPIGSTRGGSLLFSRDPRQYDLEVQARGYALP